MRDAVFAPESATYRARNTGVTLLRSYLPASGVREVCRLGKGFSWRRGETGLTGRGTGAYGREARRRVGLNLAYCVAT